MPRPLSPHLQIYRRQWSAILSISHRFTGIALTVGVFALAGWLWSLNQPQEMLERVHAHIRAWYGQLFLLGWTFSLFYHMCNGLRHLLWDTGRGLSLKVAYRSGVAVVVIAVLMTALTWACVWLGE